MEWLTRSDPEGEVPNIDWLIAVFPRSKKDDGKPYPSIKSWAKSVGTLKVLLKNRCKLKGSLVFCPYRWTNRLK